MNGPFFHDVDTVFPGVWTPHAEILCITCHGDAEFHAAKSDTGFWNYLGACDECGKSVRLTKDLAREQWCTMELQRHGMNAEMAQTGGMCSAVRVDLREREAQSEHYLLITTGEESENWIIGEYIDDECEPLHDWQRGSVDDVVHLCVSIADAKDYMLKPTQPEPLARCWCGSPWTMRVPVPGERLPMWLGCQDGHELKQAGMEEGFGISAETIVLTRDFILDCLKEEKR